MRKCDGSYTYFVPDVAYHITKWERGFAKAVNIQGTDHHGTIARVRAGLQAAGVGIPPGYPDYVLHTMVRVMRGGEEVKISKRAGSYVTLRDLIEWTSKDAVRFFLLSRKPDTEYVFDVDLALAQNNDNPVYYVQYAHARICSVLALWGGDAAALKDADLSALDSPQALALMLQLAKYPEMLRDARAAISRRTTSPSTCANWPPPTIATMMPSASWWTTRSCAMPGWPWSPPTRPGVAQWPGGAGRRVPRARCERQECKAVKNSQRGSVIVGIIIGVVLGLAAALAVAVYVTKVPIPFLNKGQSRTAEQDAAETRKNRDWDPNAPLYGKNPAKPAAAGVAGRDRAGSAAGADDPGPRTRATAGARREVAGKAPAADPLGDLAAARMASPDGTDPVLLFRAGRRLPHARGRRSPARQAVAHGYRGQGDRARAVGPPGVPRAGGPLRQEGRRRPAEGKAGGRRRRNRAGARPALTPERRPEPSG